LIRGVVIFKGINFSSILIFVNNYVRVTFLFGLME